MADLKERLQAALDQQRAEVKRLEEVATVELPAAQQQLERLEGLMKRWTPDMKAAGIRLDD